MRVPSQRRSRASLERLLDAAEALLAERGLEGLSVASLSERSGLSNGAIYWRFGTMQDLVHAVHGRIVEQLEAEHSVYDEPERWQNLGPGEVAATAARLEAELFRRHAGPLRVLALASAHDEALAARGAEAVRSAESRFVEHVGNALSVAGVPRPKRLAAAVFRVIYGALAMRIVYPEQQGPQPIGWETFIETVAEMARLRIDAELPSPAAGSAPRPTADVPPAARSEARAAAAHDPRAVDRPPVPDH